jgi:signal transduction histidine kinase
VSGMGLLLVALVLASLAACVAFLHARQLGLRLGALVRPAHELRGALTALDLGLSLVERSPLSGLELAARADGLRLQLRRGREALAEIDSLRCRRRAWSRDPLTARDRPSGAVALTVIDLATLARERARAWAQLAPAYGATLRLVWRAGPAPIRAYRAQIEQALDNVIANGLEHGGGRVVVEAERFGTRVRVSIIDGGSGLKGLPPEPRRAPRSSQRGHGLAIAARSVERHGGTIGFTRVSGRAAVVIELPLEQPTRERVRPRGAGVEQAAARATSRAA